MRIRKYEAKDRETLLEITARCFEGVSIDQNIEKRFGRIGGNDWQSRKKRDVDSDIAADANGVFVAEEDGKVIGGITARVDRSTRVGRIANFAVLPGYRGKGVGRRLVEAAMDYFRREHMECARIETLEQNEIGKAFYPRLGFVEVARQIHYAMPLGPVVHNQDSR